MRKFFLFVRFAINLWCELSILIIKLIETFNMFSILVNRIKFQIVWAITLFGMPGNLIFSDSLKQWTLFCVVSTGASAHYGNSLILYTFWRLLFYGIFWICDDNSRQINADKFSFSAVQSIFTGTRKLTVCDEIFHEPLNIVRLK